MYKISPVLIAAFINIAPAENANAQQFPESVSVMTPEGRKNVQCAKLGPGRKLTLEFLLQMHGHEDGFTAVARKQDNLDLQAAAALIQHLAAHGMDKKEIEKAMKTCGASNVRFQNLRPSAVP
jgi:hypothetical protein